MAGGVLEGVEEIDAELRRFRLEFEETRAGQGLAAAGLVDGDAHDATAAAGENPDLGTDELRQFADQAGDAVGLGGSDINGGTVESEDGGFLKELAHFLANKEPMVLLVGVEVEVLHRLGVPVHVEVDVVVGVEPRVGVAGEEEAVGARRLPENEALEFESRDAREEFDVFGEVGEVVEHERVGVVWRVVERLDQGAKTARQPVLGGLALERGEFG